MAFTLFKFLHILTMFIAVAVAVIPEVVLHWVAGSGDVRATRVFARIAARVGKLLPIGRGERQRCSVAGARARRP